MYNNYIDYNNPNLLNNIKEVYHVYQLNYFYHCEKHKVAYINKEYTYLIQHASPELLCQNTKCLQYDCLIPDGSLITGYFINKPNENIIKMVNNNADNRKRIEAIKYILSDISANTRSVIFDLDGLQKEEVNPDIISTIKAEYNHLYDKIKEAIEDDIYNR